MHEVGYPDEKGNNIKLNLDVAAKMIGISRKTLDDYFLQLRRAESFGFDFQAHQDDKMGVLRKFVKEHQKFSDETQSNTAADSDEKCNCEEETQAKNSPASVQNCNSVESKSISENINWDVDEFFSLELNCENDKIENE